MAVQDIWLLPLPETSCEQLLAQEGHVLTEAEKAQLENKRLPKGKHMYAFTRIALRHILSRYETQVAPGQWQFTRQSAGKPVISWPQSSLHFNLTHADDLLVIVVCDHAEVGVDVEACDRKVDVLALSERYYQPQEIQMLRNASDEAGRTHLFLTLWTLKEAAVKATGKGLSRALRDFSFSLQEPGRIDVELGCEAGADAEDACPGFWTFAWQDYLLSTAMLIPREQSGRAALAKEGAAEWRCFSWKWPAMPVSESLALQRQS